MTDQIDLAVAPESRWRRLCEIGLLVLLFYVYAGDAPPMVNEAHYLVKAKNFWQPEWCQSDLFASSGKAHVLFYAVFGWPTNFFSLGTTAWMGRLVGWTLLAWGLSRLTRNVLATTTSATTTTPLASLAVATLWIAGIQQGNLAGEWVLGGIEAKVPAYGFVLLALSELVIRRWNRVWIFLGIASAFHVLTGGWSVLAAMIAWWFTERSAVDRKPLLTRWLLVGGLLSLPGLVPAISLSLGADANQATEAAKVYTYTRIRHHLLPSAFEVSWYVRHGVLLTGLLFVGWVTSGQSKINLGNRRLLGFIGGAIVIALTGMLAGVVPYFAPDLAARLLRYYWFRLSDAVVPLGFALLVVQVALNNRAYSAFATMAARSLLVVAGLLIGANAYERMTAPVPPSVSNRLLGWDADANRAEQQQVFADWLSVCRWARESTPSAEVFLTPRHQQTFKWYAERGEVVNWKDVPQDADSLLEWKKRVDEVFPQNLGYVKTSINYRTLRHFRKTYGVRYMIVDRRVAGDNLPMIRLYPAESIDNENYAVYELPR